MKKVIIMVVLLTIVQGCRSLQLQTQEQGGILVSSLDERQLKREDQCLKTFPYFLNFAFSDFSASEIAKKADYLYEMYKDDFLACGQIIGIDSTKAKFFKNVKVREHQLVKGEDAFEIFKNVISSFWKLADVYGFFHRTIEVDEFSDNIVAQILTKYLEENPEIVEKLNTLFKYFEQIPVFREKMNFYEPY